MIDTEAKPKKAKKAPDHELLNTTECAAMLGISRTEFWSLRRAEKVPRPVELLDRPLWRRREIQAWIDAGCPPIDGGQPWTWPPGVLMSTERYRQLLHAELQDLSRRTTELRAAEKAGVQQVRVEPKR